MPKTFYWDNYRDKKMNLYLSRHENAFIESILKNLSPSEQILELACGSGRITTFINDMGMKVLGVDIDAVALQAFQNNLQSIPLVQADAAHLPFVNRSFQCVIAIQALEFIEFSTFLNECHRLLRQDGILVFDILNRGSYKWQLKKLFGRSTSFASANIDFGNLLNLIQSNGYIIHVIKGYNWIPFTRDSDNRFIPFAGEIERRLELHHLHHLSPKLLVAIRKI